MEKLWIVGSALSLVGIIIVCFLFTFFLDFTLEIANDPMKSYMIVEKKNEIIQGCVLGSVLIGLGSILTYISVKKRGYNAKV